MAQVPYNPAPSVGPSGQTTPFMRVPGSVGEASGTGVAQAIKGLGHEVSQAGELLGQQALAQQAIVNEAEAKDSDVAFTVQAGEAKTRFDSLKGLNAVSAKDDYIKELQKIRQDTLDGMANPASRKMLDQSISRRMGFLIVEGNTRAGTEARQAAVTSSQLRKDQANRQVDLADPTNAAVNVPVIKAETDYLLDEKGIKDPIARKEVHDAERSKMIMNTVSMRSDRSPEVAKKVLEDNEQYLDENTREKAWDKVNRGMANSQTRTVTDDIFNKLNITPETGEGKLQAALAEGKKAVEKFGKDNPYYEQALNSRIELKYNQMMRGFRDQQHGDMSTLAGFVGGKANDDRIMSMDALLGTDADPKMNALFKSLTPQNQRMVSNWVRSNASGNFEMSPEQLQKYITMRGQFNDPAQWQELYEKGPDAFMKEGFPAREKREMLNKWLEIGKEPPTYNNIVDKSIREPGIEQMIVSARIRATPADSESKRKAWFGFRGALEDAQKDWVNEHKTPAKGEDLRKMVSGILTKASVPGTVWGKNEIFGFDPANADSIPKELRAMIVETLKSRGNKDPDANAIARQYSFELYKKAMQEQKTPQVISPEEKKLKAEQSKRGFAGGGGE